MSYKIIMQIHQTKLFNIYQQMFQRVREDSLGTNMMVD